MNNVMDALAIEDEIEDNHGVWTRIAELRRQQMEIVGKMTDEEFVEFISRRQG